jgi:kojibiose phosphorylase
LEISRKKGYKGAMFPWESARTGEEETPSWARDFDGRIIKIRTNDMEHHITADIAFGVYKYYVATEDEKFMKEHGYEILIETAKFWESRVVYNKKHNYFEIRNVIGPDEFHENVNNNAYTNAMARWNILIAYSILQKIKNGDSTLYKDLIDKFKIDKRRINRWKKIIDRIHIGKKNSGIIEQFDGFSSLKAIPVNEFGINGMPMIPSSIELKFIGQYKLIKQADVVMLLYTLPEMFTLQQMKRNYDYYQTMTIHKSSLSPSMHAIVAAKIGKTKEAFKYYSISSNADLEDLHKNTKEGMHAANLGGTWQMLIHGFAGVNVFKNSLCIYPRLPKQIRSLKFKISWHGFSLNIDLNKDLVKIDPGKRVRRELSLKCSRVKIKVFNKTYTLVNNKQLTIQR